MRLQKAERNNLKAMLMVQLDTNEITTSPVPEYRRIIAGVYINQGEHHVTAAGEHHWNPHFTERHHDYQDYFELLLLDDLVSQVGENGWAVRIMQVSQETGAWFADVYVDDSNLYQPICSIIKQKMPTDFKLTFFLKGSISDYLRF